MSETPQSTPSRPGALDVVATGYGLVWRLRRPLAVVVIPTLLPGLSADVAADLLPAGGGAAIVDGSLLTGGANGLVSIAAMLLLIIGWTFAIACAVAVAGRFLLGSPPEATDDGGQRYSAGGIVLRHWRIALAAGRSVALIMALAIGGGAAALFALGSVAAAGALGVIVFIAGLVATAVLIARMLFGIPAAVLDAVPVTRGLFAITSNRMWATAGAFLIGGVGIPWGATVALSAIRDALVLNGGTVLATVLTALGDGWLVVVVTVQACVLATGYVHTREAPSVVEQRLGRAEDRGHGIRARTSAAAVALVALPALVSGAVTLWNPYDAVEVTTEPNGNGYDARFAVWPDDSPPTIADDIVIQDCVDIACGDMRWRSLGERKPWEESAAFTPDGAFVSALGPMVDDRIQLQRCSREACELAWLNWDGSGAEHAVFAMAAATDGTVWLAEARDVTEHPDSENEQAPEQTELRLTRCADWTCEQRNTTTLGVLDVGLGTNGGARGAMLDERPRTGEPERVFSYPPQQLSAGLDGKGNPLLVFRGRASVWLGTCDPVDCADPRLVEHSQHLERVIPLGGAADGVFGWTTGGQLMSCVERTCDGDDNRIPGVPPARPLGDMAVQLTSHGLLAVVVEPVPEAGVRITIGGEPHRQWLTTLIHCSDSSCGDANTIPLSRSDDHPSRAVLLTRDDGRVLVLTINEAISLRLPGTS